MQYLAIARKWRPNTFDEVVGQSHIVQTLKNAILNNRVAHAYLFSGVRGTGKTSVARIFAKALRCPNVKNANPCNNCPECDLISQSRSVDVVEIDGASNNGVEAVRGIRENVIYGASSGTYKIYIIDEVHMLSLSAFNALLKTLEEPPAHVIFIFATTELQKIPLTILSRCQRYEFRRLTSQLITERLKQILESENLKVSEEGLRILASHSDGSLRDSLSLLDQVLSYYGQESQNNTELTDKKVAEALGVSETSTISLFVSHLLKGEADAALKIIEQTYLAGMDLKNFCERCLEETRLVYLIVLSQKQKIDSLSADKLDIASTHFSLLQIACEKVSLIQVERMAQILSKTISQLNWSSLPRFAVEMAAVRICELDGLSEIESQILNQAPKIEEKPTPPIKTRSTIVQRPPPQPVLRPEPPRVSQPSFSTQSPPPALMNPPQRASTWEHFVETLMKKRPLLGALLAHANFKLSASEGEKRQCVLAFSEDSFYEKQAMENRSEIERQIKDYFGPEVELSFSNDTKSTHSSIEAKNQAEERNIKQQAIKHPAVQEARELLGADIIDVTIQS